MRKAEQHAQPQVPSTAEHLPSLSTSSMLGKQVVVLGFSFSRILILECILVASTVIQSGLHRILRPKPLG